MPEKEKEPPALAPLLPLRAAAAMVYTSATAKYTSDMETLNNMATLIARVTPVFTRGTNESDVDRVFPIEISEGTLERGGDELRFSDGRPLIKGLFILLRELENVIAQVLTAYGKKQGNGTG